MTTKRAPTSGWTRDFPTTPGDYLFYGDFVPATSRTWQPGFHVCTCSQATGGLVYVVGNLFLYPSEADGLFSPLKEKPPALAPFGLPVHPNVSQKDDG
jgi:hypothetical protein